MELLLLEILYFVWMKRLLLEIRYFVWRELLLLIAAAYWSTMVVSAALLSTGPLMSVKVRYRPFYVARKTACRAVA